MLQFLSNLMFLLEQTASEKKLTFLYVGMFLAFILLLFMDSLGKKSFIGGNKLVVKILYFLLFLGAIGLIIAYFRLK